MTVQRVPGFPGSVEVGPYSQASIAGGLVWTTGQVPWTDAERPDAFAEQARVALENLERALVAAGSDLDHVIKVNAFLTDEAHLQVFNAVYAEVFGDARPSRTTICTRIFGIPLEVECVAALAPRAVPIAADVDARFARGALPTLGHTLDRGFAESGIVRIAGHGQAAGRARTLRLDEPDAVAVDAALARLERGDVLVIDLGGDVRHAPVGAVTQARARAAGASAIVVEGIVTDIDELRAGGVIVHARGLGACTTKRLGGTGHELGGVVRVGGVEVRDGDLVIADANGVLFLDAALEADASALLDAAIASDEAEPALIRDILGAG